MITHIAANTQDPPMYLGTITVIIVVGLACLAGWWFRQRPDLDQPEPKIEGHTWGTAMPDGGGIDWFYPRGWRLLGPDPSGEYTLYRISHEDPEGWWTGSETAHFTDPADARTFVNRLTDAT